ncbi:hypothetical protein BH20CHL1_BH20CHL1_02180 [soil metagenome]
MSSSEGSGSAHPVNRLIRELAESRRPATDAEIEAIRKLWLMLGSTKGDWYVQAE